MAGTFIKGETKVRPGAYFNIDKAEEDISTSAINGITAVLFRSTMGPLGEVVELSSADGYEDTFGTDLTTDALKEAFLGGAKTIYAYRLGSGGTAATVTLYDEDGNEAVTITTQYPCSLDLSVTIREKLSDSSIMECIFYNGTTQFEKVEFDAGTGEAAALVDALSSSTNFTATLTDGQDDAELAIVTQSEFTSGEDPTVTVSDYSNGFSAIEAYIINTVCVDTEDTDVHALLQSFVDRVLDAGSFVIGVVAETHSVDLETRMEHALGFNDEKICYVLNAYVSKSGTEIDGYQTAARIAGMVGAVVSNSSLTHTVITGFTEILETLTNTQIIAAEKSGCIVLTYNSDKQVWIDYAINTLVSPADNQDDGWKKIRRVKTRFELMRRINEVADYLVGIVDNDTNGRATVISQMESVGEDMISEGKLISCSVTESSIYEADGDSAWFEIDVVDKDSMEHIYLFYKFRFSTSEDE